MNPVKIQQHYYEHSESSDYSFDMRANKYEVGFLGMNPVRILRTSYEHSESSDYSFDMRANKYEVGF